MNSFQIKLVAIATMVVDHIGVYFFPDQILLRIIGRISFPLFSFMIANGAHYTANINKYISRIFIFALISQVPFYVVNSLMGLEGKLNILFTLFLALSATSLIKRIGNKYVATFLCILIAIAAELFGADYGAFGVLLTVSFYIFFKNLNAITFSFLLLAFFDSIAPVFSRETLLLSELDFGPLISVLSLIFIINYNHKSGPKIKYLFYIFYPAQFLIYYFVHRYILF